MIKRKIKNHNLNKKKMIKKNRILLEIKIKHLNIDIHNRFI